jgi:hypothetical protein
MPKPLTEHGREDWRRLRPLLHAYKSARYRVIDALYRRRRPRGGDSSDLPRRIKAQKVLVTVAFNDPQAIEWQSRLIRHYVPGALHVVADNSPDDASAAATAHVAAVRGTPYLRLPRNPWASPSRSHGLALNWIWHNLIAPGEPQAFGFLDDDLFPTAPDDPFARLASQPFYGVRRRTGPRWYLWAGYCFFRFDAVRDKSLDFGQDWFVGLDTGGGNWRVLYRDADPAALNWPAARTVGYRPEVDPGDAAFQWFDAWLHEFASSGSEMATEKRRALEDILAPHLSAANHSG